MVDTSADGIRKDARAAMKGHLEALGGFDIEPQAVANRECLEALSKVGELCREEGAGGEANRTALGEVGKSGQCVLRLVFPLFFPFLSVPWCVPLFRRCSTCSCCTDVPAALQMGLVQ